MFSIKYQNQNVSRHIGINYNIFMPYHCNVCLLLGTSGEMRGSTEFKLSEKVVFCRGCQFTRYCSEEHQTLDLNAHRQLCNAFQDIKKKFNVSHPYLVRGQPTTQYTLERATFQVKFLLRQIMKRPLNYSEEEQTSFPPHCAVCYTFENVTPCADCAGVGYCSDEHAKEAFENHRLRCGLLQTYYCRFKLCYPPPPESIVKNLHKVGKNMAELDLIGAFQEMSNLKLPICPTETLSDYHLFACAADFSTIATICFTLSEFDMTTFTDKDKFILFIIGASIEADLWFLEIHTKFFFLQQPNITTLELYFIGPRVEFQDPKALIYTFNGKKRKVVYFFYTGSLDTFGRYMNFKPSMIAAFNCGFAKRSPYHTFTSVTSTGELGETDNRDTWLGTLSEIVLTYHTPILITSSTLLEAEFDFHSLVRAAKLNHLEPNIESLLEPTVNPYRDFRPLRNWQLMLHDDIFYRNGYVQVAIASIKNPPIVKGRSTKE